MKKTIEDWRKEIDVIDEELLKVLSRRLSVVKEIGKIKKERGHEFLDEKRWQEVITTRLVKAQKHGLPPTAIKKVFNIIHKYSVELEGEIT